MKTRKVIKETETKGKQPLPILPEEIIEDILKRLPVESLVRFSCTCKRWCSLIFRDPKFNKAHIDHAKRPSWKMLEIRDSRKILRRTIDCDCNIATLSRKKPKKYLPYHPICLLGSCNGLLFFQGYGIFDPSKQYVLWNPYTNSIKRINSNVKGMFYSSISGLSYDRTTDDYKAITVLEDHLGKHCPYMFSLRRNSWKKLTSSTNMIGRMNNDSVGITLDNGICHWKIDLDERWKIELKRWKIELGVQRSLSIICFDPVVEKFNVVPLPDKLRSCAKGRSSRIGALDGCLSLIHGNSIWVMKEYGCWTELYVLQLSENLMYKPIGYNSNKDQVLVKKIDYAPCIEIADLNEGVVKEPSDNLVRSIDVSTAVPYTESLLCPWLGLAI